LAAALARGREAEVLAAFVDARVFAAIAATATATEVQASGLPAESAAEMAVLLLEAPDGSRALPVFQDLGALRRWRLDARPVPLTGAQACAAALDERAGAVVLDPAGAATAIGGDQLATLAQGWVPVAGSGLASRTGWTDLTPAARASPELVAAIRRAVKGEGLRSARLLEGPDGPVLGVAANAPLGPADLAALAQRVASRLGRALPPRGLDLAQVPVRGPGQELLRGRFRRGR
jgi:hypothetical protein